VSNILELDNVISKINNGEKFGLFDNGERCYFRDGSKVSYTLLWRAVKITKQIEDGQPCGSLRQLYPELFVGSHNYRYSRHDWSYTTSS